MLSLFILNKNKKTYNNKTDYYTLILMKRKDKPRYTHCLNCGHILNKPRVNGSGYCSKSKCNTARVKANKKKDMLMDKEFMFM